jgi:hypothetical protein
VIFIKSLGDAESDRERETRELKEASIQVSLELMDKHPEAYLYFGGHTHVMGGPCVKTAPAGEKFLSAWQGVTCMTCRVSQTLGGEHERADVRESLLPEEDTSGWAKRYAEAFKLKFAPTCTLAKGCTCRWCLR